MLLVSRLSIFCEIDPYAPFPGTSSHYLIRKWDVGGVGVAMIMTTQLYRFIEIKHVTSLGVKWLTR